MKTETIAIIFLFILIIVPILWKFLGYMQEKIMHREEQSLIINYKLLDGFLSNKKSKAAGCVIEQDDKIVFVWYPFSFHNFWCSWKYSLPGGETKNNLPAWKVAAIEAFEETGIEVEICQEIREWDHFILFLAKPIKKVSDSHFKSFSKKWEISKIELSDPRDMLLRKARFRDQQQFIIEWFEKRLASKKMPIKD